MTWAYYPNDPLHSWESLVAETTWQPGAELEVGQPMPGYLELRVKLHTTDSKAPDNEVLIGHKFPLPRHVYDAGREPMVTHLRRSLQRVAQHEADEWLVIGGERLFDPHGAVTTPRG